MTQPDDELLTLGDRFDDQLNPETRDLEAPTADAAEQAMPANPLDAAELASELESALPFEANEYDVLEQKRVVELDDDYR
jgi:hypothetical protein